MHCVYHAIEDHLLWLNKQPLYSDWDNYIVTRIKTGTRDDTFGGLIPFIIGRICNYRELSYSVEYSEWFPKKFWLDQADEKEQPFVEKGEWHINHITESAGIYLPVYMMHAVFLENKPEYECAMSIKIRQR